MQHLIFAAALTGGIVSLFVCVALGKRVGDELASWVIAHEQDGGSSPQFGVELVGRQRRLPSLRAYRPYATRYRQLRRARGENVKLATRFAVIYYAQFVGVAVALGYLLISSLMAI